MPARTQTPSNNPSPQRRGPSYLIAFLLAAYGLLVVDASLYPFVGWRVPLEPFWAFLREPWPRYLSSWEIPLNIAGYLPLGLLLSLSLMSRCSRIASVMLAGLAGLILSLCMESLQGLLPNRIPSNLDIASNTVGTVWGAVMGVITDRTWALRSRLPALRSRIFAGGSYADFGATLMPVWLFAQLNPEIGYLGTTSLKSLLGSQSAFAYSAGTYFWSELVLTALNLLIVCILLRMLTVTRRTCVLAMVFLVLCATLLKIAGGQMLLRLPQPWLWMTPGCLVGVLVGAAFFVLWERRGGSSAKWIGLSAVIGIQLISLLMPANPYLAVMVQPIARGHFSSLNGATWWTAQVWPWLALLCLLGLSSAPRLPRNLTRAQA